MILCREALALLRRGVRRVAHTLPGGRTALATPCAGKQVFFAYLCSSRHIDIGIFLVLEVSFVICPQHLPALCAVRLYIAIFVFLLFLCIPDL